LTSRATKQLAIDAQGLLFLRGDHVQSAQGECFGLDANVGTTPRHVGRYCNHTVFARLRYYFCFLVMVFGV
jgi:hypothetical protein